VNYIDFRMHRVTIKIERDLFSTISCAVLKISQSVMYELENQEILLKDLVPLSCQT